jgi:hypothetical protein
MKKIICLPVLFLLFSCETGVEINTDCVLKHTAEMIQLENTAGDITQGLVNLSWTWIWGIPDGDGIIIERQISAEYDSIGYVSPIESLMTFTDTADQLTSGLAVSYQLGFLSGKSVDYFISSDFSIPEFQHFYQPDTEFVTIDSVSPLVIAFSGLTGFDETDIAIYETSFSSIDSIMNTPVLEILEILTNPIIDTTITDTILTVTNADSLIQPGAIYMVKISASVIGQLDYITDTSIGMRAFIRN